MLTPVYKKTDRKPWCTGMFILSHLTSRLARGSSQSRWSHRSGRSALATGSAWSLLSNLSLWVTQPQSVQLY